MRTIGLLGGTSWPSTVEYYRILNRLVQERLGGYHSAELILLSIDFHALKSLFHDGWDEIPRLLRRELDRLARLGPDCILICNNTMHKALDLLQDLPPIPIFHIVDLTAAHAAERGLRRLLLLGTKFTMEDGYFHRYLEKYGLEVVVPTPSDRDAVQAAQSELVRGTVRDSHRDYLRGLIRSFPDVDGVILGCTELPLAVDPAEHTIAVLDPMTIQCRRAVDFALA
jgi:aspartate racemase